MERIRQMVYGAKLMKNLYFSRHGQSVNNIKNQWSGSTNTPLTDEGHDQAKIAGKKAADEGLQFDLIISSPLERAHHTAQHIATAVGYPHDKIVLDDRVIERHFGELENTANPKAVALRAIGERKIEIFNGVETVDELQKRLDDFYAYLHDLPHENILVVAHGASGRALYRTVKNLPVNHHSTRFKNAEIHKFI
jgi:broad specificity phosphatase PhoE